MSSVSCPCEIFGSQWASGLLTRSPLDPAAWSRSPTMCHCGCPWLPWTGVEDLKYDGQEEGSEVSSEAIRTMIWACFKAHSRSSSGTWSKAKLPIFLLKAKWTKAALITCVSTFTIFMIFMMVIVKITPSGCMNAGQSKPPSSSHTLHQSVSSQTCFG